MAAIEQNVSNRFRRASLEHDEAANSCILELFLATLCGVNRADAPMVPIAHAHTRILKVCSRHGAA